MEFWQGEVSIEFELRAKKVSETGPWLYCDKYPASMQHYNNSQFMMIVADGQAPT